MSRGRGEDPASFEFISRWQLSVPVEAVWGALNDFHKWPEWWPALETVEETDPGDSEGIGQRAVSTWRGPLGYSLSFEIEAIQKDYLRTLKGKAEGELTGAGTWHLSPVDEGQWTQIAYEWTVMVTKRWMQFLSPVARPAFVYSHDHVMKEGAEGMAEYLGCEIRGFATGEEARAD